MNPIKLPTCDVSKLPSLSARPAEAPALPKLQHPEKLPEEAMRLAKDTFERASAQLDSVGELRTDMMLKMQMMMSLMARAATVRSSLEKRHSDANSAIIGKIRG